MLLIFGKPIRADHQNDPSKVKGPCHSAGNRSRPTTTRTFNEIHKWRSKIRTNPYASLKARSARFIVQAVIRREISRAHQNMTSTNMQAQKLQHVQLHKAIPTYKLTAIATPTVTANAGRLLTAADVVRAPWTHRAATEFPSPFGVEYTQLYNTACPKVASQAKIDLAPGEPGRLVEDK
jgi:hypothetical protein